MDDMENGRRATDNQRFERLEANYTNLAQAVHDLDARMQIVNLEQSHTRELFTARLNTQDKVLEVEADKSTKILAALDELIREPEKTPAGKALMSAVQSIVTRVETEAREQTSRADGIATDVKKLNEWQQRAEGALLFAKFIGWTTLAAIVMAAAKGFYELGKAIT